jgi:hypothetical protein
MNVKELIKALRTLEPTDEVYLSRDEEGNGFEPLNNLEKLKYLDGEVYLRELTPELEKQGYSEEDALPEGEGIPVIVLWP